MRYFYHGNYTKVLSLLSEYIYISYSPHNMFHVFYFFATITFAMILFYLQMPDENLKIILEETDDSFEMLEDDHIDPDFVPCSDSSDCTENFIPVGQVIFKGSDNLHIDENSSSNVVPPLSPVIPLIDDISLRRASSQLQHVPSPIDPSGPLINKITDYPFPRTQRSNLLVQVTILQFVHFQEPQIQPSHCLLVKRKQRNWIKSIFVFFVERGLRN